MKPLLMVDVDGPLNPWAASGRRNQKAGYRRYRIDGYVVYLKRSHGQALLDLTDVFDLVWCTTWGHQANTDIGPRIGLPPLPVIEFGSVPIQPESRLYYKTLYVQPFADDRPFAWVDDEISNWDSMYLSDVHEADTLLLKIDPTIGLAEEDFAALRRWGEGVTAGDHAA